MGGVKRYQSIILPLLTSDNNRVPREEERGKWQTRSGVPRSYNCWTNYFDRTRGTCARFRSVLSRLDIALEIIVLWCPPWLSSVSEESFIIRMIASCSNSATNEPKHTAQSIVYLQYNNILQMYSIYIYCISILYPDFLPLHFYIHSIENPSHHQEPILKEKQQQLVRLIVSINQSLLFLFQSLIF